MFLSHSPARSAILVVVLMPICDAWSNANNTFGITWLSFLLILLMAEILHQLIGSLCHYQQVFFTFQVVSRISAISSTIASHHESLNQIYD